MQRPPDLMRLLLVGVTAMLAAAGPGIAQDTLTPGEAANFFGTETGDAYSSLFLHQIFGPLFPSVTGETGPTIFSIIVGYFNVIVLAVGGMMLFWNLTVGVLQSAHEGAILGQRWSSLWAPLRVIFAVGLLAPLPGLGGYNTGQAGIAWIVKGSTNAGSYMWGSVADLVIDGNMPITPVNETYDRDALRQVFMNEVCKVHVNYQREQAGNEGRIASRTVERGQSSGVGSRTSITTYIEGDSGSESVCGEVAMPELPEAIARTGNGSTIPDDIKPEIADAFNQAHLDSYLSLRSDFERIVTETYQAARTEGDTIPDMRVEFANAISAADRILDDGLEGVRDTIAGAGSANIRVRDVMRERINGSCSDGNASDGSLACYGEGWIGAGSWYLIMAKFNNEITGLLAGVPTVGKSEYYNRSGLSVIPGIGPGAIQQETEFVEARYFDFYDRTTIPLVTLGFSMPQSYVADVTGTVAENEESSLWNKLRAPLEFATTTALNFTDPAEWGEDPMIGLSNIGKSLINLATLILGIATLAGPFSAGAASIMVVPFSFLLAAGATLHYILPILPFFYWVLAVIGYFILVIEAVVAVNLWALSHMRMDGEGISGEAGQRGWMMLLSLLMTPMLMVLGFLVGMMIFRATSILIDTGMHYAINAIYGSGIAVWFFGMMTYGLLLALIYVLVLERSFSLVTEFPSRVMRWVGEQVDIAGNEQRAGQLAGAGAVYGANKFGNKIESGVAGILRKNEERNSRLSKGRIGGQ